MMDRERVAVGILEERLVADARIEDVALEHDSARFELGASRRDVVDSEGDRVIVRLKRDAECV
jgi:hypothetical protein